jgi:hypothetical protein
MISGHGVVGMKHKIAPYVFTMQSGQPFREYFNAKDFEKPISSHLARGIFHGVGECLQKLHERVQQPSLSLFVSVCWCFVCSFDVCPQ